MKSKQQPMQNIWLSLLWKEWHEHKWKLLVMTLVLVLGGVGILRNAGGYDEYTDLQFRIELVITILICYSLISGLFLGMSTAARESGRGTLQFLQAMPVPRWKAGVTKLGFALLTAIVPLVIFMLAVGSFFSQTTSTLSDSEVEKAFAIHGEWETLANWVLVYALASILGVSSLLLWVAALGVKLSDEIRAGAVSFLVICFIWFLLASGWKMSEQNQWILIENLGYILMSVSPGIIGFLALNEWDYSEVNVYALYLVSIIGHAGIVVWYLRRYAQIEKKTSQNSAESVASSSNISIPLGPPMPNQLMAIVWKQLRETGPLALLAVGVVLLMSAFVWIAEKGHMSAQEFGEVLGAIALMVCFFVTLVVGIGIFFEELKPKLDDFWRSRPMNYNLWFSVKIFMGATLLVAAFGTLFAVSYWLTDTKLLGNGEPTVVEVLSIGLGFLSCYLLSVASYCVLRQPIYAVVVTIALFYLGLFLIPWTSGFVSGFFSSYGGEYLAIAIAITLMCIAQMAAIAIAWLAIRNNWGLKN